MWQSHLTREELASRAAFFSAIRAYFESTDVIEVDTPFLSNSANTDPFIESFQTTHCQQGRMWLHTSPEYCMKRLIASGAGSIFQIARVFRNEPVGRNHEPEFQMLEWYRTGYSSEQLITDIDNLLLHLGMVTKALPRLTYHQVCLDAGIDIHEACLEDYRKILETKGVGLSHALLEETDKTVLRQLFFTHIVEPNLPITGCYITHFPVEDASLATLIEVEGRLHADRFELYIQGVELANGFAELQDADEQRKRFELDNKHREILGLPTHLIDEQLIAALKAGLPKCAGVAMGIDRMLMLHWGKNSISEVIPFSQRQN